MMTLNLEGVEEFAAVVDDKRLAEVVKAANQEMINRIIQKCSAARLANELSKFPVLRFIPAVISAINALMFYRTADVGVSQLARSNGDELKQGDCRLSAMSMSCLFNFLMLQLGK